jgi:hypothetical protein
MYNYYTEEKRKKESKTKLKEKKDQNKMKQKRHIERDQLVANYESRLKNFVYTMAAEPVHIKEYQPIIETCRKQLYDEEANKILDRHGFILKGYKTEKERIEEYLRERNEAYLAHSPRETKNSFHSLKRNPTLIQPNMRFKPRSDIERIYDINNEYNIGRIDKKIIERHLTALGLNHGKTVYSDDEELQTIFQNNKEYEFEKAKKNIEKIRKERKETLNIRDKRFKLGEVSMKHFLIDTRNIMADLHHKTFFKGASSFTLKESKSAVNVVRENTTETNNFKPNGKNLSKNESMNNIRTLISTDIRSDVAQANPLLYNINLNPYKKREDEFDPEALNQLKELAFRKDQVDVPHVNKKTGFFDKFKIGYKSSVAMSEDQQPLIKNNSVNYFRRNSENPDFIIKKPDEDKIRIDGKEFNRDDINSITKIVLKQCNFFHNKNKNNQKSLKAGSGMLMQTNGLSVIEFGKKYHISSYNSMNSTKY